MDQESMYRGFTDEFTKIAKARDVGQLLSSLAERSGVRPSMLPSIKQVTNQANSGNRSRAAEIAKGVRGYLKEKGKGAATAASTAVPRSAPGLKSVGLGQGG